MHFVSSQVEPISQQSASSSSSSSVGGRRRWDFWSVARTLVFDIPLTIVFGLLVFSYVVQKSYLTYVTPLIDSYRHGEPDRNDGFIPFFENDFTYYNRQCDASDISTTDSNDLIMHEDYTSEQAADIMLNHGAIIYKNILSNNTVRELRQYIESRNHIQDELPWDEKFFEEEGRLSLGLGVDDHPIIGQALKEVGSHKVLKRALEGIVGPDPAIVEISTLTAMVGVEDQGIHSDSDYFGSSLLYTRNFLHSYTMFMSLQDTTAKMGPTTLCPGTHMCANEDLEQVCLENGAFEASSNGCTGKECGALLTGDAMMFNQNVWHRGAYNQDPANPNTNRAMFIVTFVSRTDLLKGDYRYSPFGTYYYQRWNMWGHTYNDLKEPNTIMTQPFGMSRAFGLWKPKGSKFGVTFVENFAREIANNDNFYDPYELHHFAQFLTDIGVPKFLHGKYSHTKDDDDLNWEQFLKEMMENVLEFLGKCNLVAIGAYLAIRIVLWFVQLSVQFLFRRNLKDDDDTKKSTAKRGWIPKFLKRLILTHGSVCVIGYAGFYFFVDQSELAHHIKSGRVNIPPFPDPNSDTGREMRISASNYFSDKSSFSSPKTSSSGGIIPTPTEDNQEYTNGIGPTTFPEKHDILVSTRFDSDFLASYNNMLDYHPGNKRFNSIIAEFASSDIFPKKEEETESHALILGNIVGLIQEDGGLLGQKDENIVFSPRFLYQDPSTGFWTVMTDDEAMEVTRRAIQMKKNHIIGGLGKHLKSTLAECRFGNMRDTVFCRKFNPLFVREWETVLYGTPATTATATTSHSGSSESRLKSFVTAPAIMKRSRRVPQSNSNDERNVVLSTGDWVIGPGRRGQMMRAKILKVYSERECHVKYASGGHNIFRLNYGLRLDEQYEEGDIVETKIKDNSRDGNNRRRREQWVKAQILAIYPIGYVDIMLLQNNEVRYVRREEIRQYHDISKRPRISFKVDINNVNKFVEGERVEANYLGEGEWFDAFINKVHEDGTIDIDYADDDVEDNVPPSRVRYPRRR